MLDAATTFCSLLLRRPLPLQQTEDTRSLALHVFPTSAPVHYTKGLFQSKKGVVLVLNISSTLGDKHSTNRKKYMPNT